MLGIGLGIGIGKGRASLAAGPGGGVPKTVNAVEFDGTNDYLTRGAGLTGAADSKVGILSTWVKKFTDGASVIPFSSKRDDDVNTSFILNFTTANTIIIEGRGTDNAIKLEINTLGNETIVVADGWVNLLAAWDVANSKAQLYLDDVAATFTPTIVDAVLDHTRGEWAVGTKANDFGGFKYDGCMAELYFNMETFLDLDVASNRRKFITAGLKPVDLGSDGSLPTGTAPIVFLEGATASWHTNKGDGGGFTEVGALTDCADSPSD